ncbi:MAG: prolyl oligopeptidase family serine peptidase [Deltaproteobacteria bacterium]|nr:prolyl oligopeptidase family serine peptidase [Deltaproteobacteria bacterium]
MWLAIVLGVLCGPPPLVPPVNKSTPDSVPVPTRRENIVEKLHGQAVADPYRWLEDGDAEEVKHWTAAQNALTEQVVSKLPGREAIEARLKSLFDAGSLGTPLARGKGKTRPLFYTRRQGQQNQPVLYVRDAKGERVLVDVNTLAKDGTRSLDWWTPSDSGARLAYGVSADGSENSVLRVRDVKTGVDLPDEIPYARAASIAWLPDEKSFYYTRYPAPGTLPKGEDQYHRSVYLHNIGADPSADALVFPTPAHARDMTDWPNVSISPDGRYLGIVVSQGWSKSEMFLLDRRRPERGLQAMVTGQDAIYSIVEMTNDRFYVITNEGAPRYRVFEVNAAKPARADWRLLLPETNETLETVVVTKSVLITQTLADAASRLRVYSLHGKALGEVVLPALGTVGSITGDPRSDEVFYSYSSFVAPNTIFKLRAKAQPHQAPQEWARLDMPINPNDFVVRQEFYASKDGTKIPLFLVHKKSTPPDGRNAAVLYGYGGFNISLSPWFNAHAVPLLEKGVVFAVANLRGGGEYGEAWHQAGMLGKKQNVFDDVIAAAEYLRAQKLVAADRLAIEGRSNGGLLVGAAITQRPDLFRAAICGVPLLDMIRYPKFRIAKLWVPEYGDPEKPDEFTWLRAYSPYHNARPNTAYPATMFVTAASDTRVDPMHARKMTALLQAQNSSKHPIFLRLESQAGHGAGKPLSKVLAQYVDELAFLFAELGL